MLQWWHVSKHNGQIKYKCIGLTDQIWCYNDDMSASTMARSSISVLGSLESYDPTMMAYQLNITTGSNISPMCSPMGYDPTTMTYQESIIAGSSIVQRAHWSDTILQHWHIRSTTAGSSLVQWTHWSDTILQCWHIRRALQLDQVLVHVKP